MCMASFRCSWKMKVTAQHTELDEDKCSVICGGQKMWHKAWHARRISQLNESFTRPVAGTVVVMTTLWSVVMFCVQWCDEPMVSAV